MIVELGELSTLRWLPTVSRGSSWSQDMYPVTALCLPVLHQGKGGDVELGWDPHDDPPTIIPHAPCSESVSSIIPPKVFSLTHNLSMLYRKNPNHLQIHECLLALSFSEAAHRWCPSLMMVHITERMLPPVQKHAWHLHTSSCSLWLLVLMWQKHLVWHTTAPKYHHPVHLQDTFTLSAYKLSIYLRFIFEFVTCIIWSVWGSAKCLLD